MIILEFLDFLSIFDIKKIYDVFYAKVSTYKLKTVIILETFA